MHKKILIGIIGIALFSVLLSACTIVDASNLASGPQVKMGGSTSGVLQLRRQGVDLSSHHRKGCVVLLVLLGKGSVCLLPQGVQAAFM